MIQVLQRLMAETITEVGVAQTLFDLVGEEHHACCDLLHAT